MLPLILSTLMLLVMMPVGLDLLLGIRKLRLLHHVPKAQHNLPSITIIVAVLNEETHIETAVSSWLKQDYPNLNIIIVNDRSTDNTAEICNHMSDSYSHVQVVHLDRLDLVGWVKTMPSIKGQNMPPQILFSSPMAMSAWTHPS